MPQRLRYPGYSAGLRLERRVAEIFRALGARVEHDVSIAGSQIDLVVREESASGGTITTAVECKSFNRPVGIDVVLSFGSLSSLLRDRNLIDRAMLVSTNGFTRHARDAARAHKVDLVELADLEQKVSSSKTRVTEKGTLLEEVEEPPAGDRKPRAFVLMPFLQEFVDIFVLGIREVAEKMNFVVERADSIEHNGDIIDLIREKIQNCDVVIADTTGKNPNVMYEIGLAHGLKKETILIAKTGSDIPFDVHGINHILYDSIIDLREKLEKRINATILSK